MIVVMSSRGGSSGGNACSNSGCRVGSSVCRESYSVLLVCLFFLIIFVVVIWICK